MSERRKRQECPRRMAESKPFFRHRCTVRVPTLKKPAVSRGVTNASRKGSVICCCSIVCLQDPR
jgi:hypothetical protein